MKALWASMSRIYQLEVGRPVNQELRGAYLARRRVAMVLMTLGAWVVAFVVVLALLTLLGDELQSLPLALRALVISGVLVFLMANLVVPALNVAITQGLGAFAGRPPRERSTARAPPRSEDGSHVVREREMSAR